MKTTEEEVKEEEIHETTRSISGVDMEVTITSERQTDSKVLDQSDHCTIDDDQSSVITDVPDFIKSEPPDFIDCPSCDGNSNPQEEIKVKGEGDSRKSEDSETENTRVHCACCGTKDEYKEEIDANDHDDTDKERSNEQFFLPENMNGFLFTGMSSHGESGAMDIVKTLPHVPCVPEQYVNFLPNTMVKLSKSGEKHSNPIRPKNLNKKQSDTSRRKRDPRKLKERKSTRKRRKKDMHDASGTRERSKKAVPHSKKMLKREEENSNCSEDITEPYTCYKQKTEKVQQYFVCDVEGCGKVFTQRKCLKEHGSVHSTKRNFLCNQCGKAFKTWPILRRHGLTHSGEARFVCDEEGCGKTFKLKMHLASHRYSHIDVRSFHCEFFGCGKSFKTKSNLRDHQKVHQVGDTSYVCTYEGCGRTFYVKRSLNRHKLRFHNPKSFTCNVVDCQKVFRTKEYYQIHLKTHFPNNEPKERYVCTECDKVLTTKQSFRRHKSRVHMLVRQFICQICGKGFKCGASLKVHEFTHTGQKPFACDYHGCGKAFATKGGLKSHTFGHTGEKPYQCPNPHCGIICRSKVSLDTHRLEFHGSEPSG